MLQLSRKNHIGSKIIHKLKNKYKFSAIMENYLINFGKSKFYMFGIFKAKKVRKEKHRN